MPSPDHPAPHDRQLRLAMMARMPPRPWLPRPLAALLGLAAVLALAWAIVVPPLQGPDETSHYSATERLVERGVVIPSGGDADRPSREVVVAARESGLGPLIGNIAARPYWLEEDRARLDASVAALGAARHQPAGPPRIGQGEPPIQGANRNPPLYYTAEAVPYAIGQGGSISDRLLLMRLLNIPLYLVTIALTWLLCRQMLGPRELPALAGAGAVALTPQLTFVTGVVNPDNLLIALTTLFMVLAVRIVRRGMTTARAIGLGAVLLAAALTHARGIVLVPAAALAVLLAARHSTVSRRQRRWIFAIGAGAAVVAAFAYAVSGITSGVPGSEVPPGHGKHPFSLPESLSYLWQFYLPKLGFMESAIGPDYGVREAYVETFWGAFGSLEVQFPGWIYDLLGALSLIGATALVALAIRSRRTLAASAAPLAVFAVLALSIVSALHYVAYRSLLVDPSDPIIVGRHLLPLVALMGLGVAALVSALPRRAAPFAVALLLSGGVLLELSGLGLTLSRFSA